MHYIGNRYNLLKLLSVSKLQLEIQFVKQNTSMATNLEKGEKEGEVGGSRWNRLPFLAMYSLSQSRCLLFTYSCWELDFGMEEVKRICQIIPVTSKVSFPGRFLLDRIQQNLRKRTIGMVDDGLNCLFCQ